MKQYCSIIVLILLVTAVTASCPYTTCASSCKTKKIVATPNVQTITATTGSGISSYSLSKYLIGTRDLFEKYDTFIDYLNVLFAPKKETEDRLLRLEVEVKLLREATNNQITEEMIQSRIGLIKSKELNKVYVTDSGLSCNYKLGNCFRLTQGGGKK